MQKNLEEAEAEFQKNQKKSGKVSSTKVLKPKV